MKTAKKPEVYTKVLIVRFVLSEGTYACARQFYSDREIREILSAGGEGELGQLLHDSVEMAQRQPNGWDDRGGL